MVIVDNVTISKSFGWTAIGFGGSASVRFFWNDYTHKVLKQVHPKTGIEPKAMSVLNDLSTFVLKKVLMHEGQRVSDSAAI